MEIFRGQFYCCCKGNLDTLLWCQFNWQATHSTVLFDGHLEACYCTSLDSTFPLPRYDVYCTCARCPGTRWPARWTRSWRSWTLAQGWCGWSHTHPDQSRTRPIGTHTSRSYTLYSMYFFTVRFHCQNKNTLSCVSKAFASLELA